MYKIGDFARIVDLPVKTLRFYAEKEILLPSEIDSFTGYRYYNERNIRECELIKLLKALSFSLQEIKLYTASFDEKIILHKQNEIKEQIQLLKLQCKKLNLFYEKLQQEEDIEKLLGKLKETPKEKVLRRNYERRNFR